MFSVAPNIVLAPNMTQNAERKHRTQNTNTAHIRLQNILNPILMINFLDCTNLIIVKKCAIACFFTFFTLFFTCPHTPEFINFTTMFRYHD